MQRPCSCAACLVVETSDGLLVSGMLHQERALVRHHHLEIINLPTLVGSDISPHIVGTHSQHLLSPDPLSDLMSLKVVR